MTKETESFICSRVLGVRPGRIQRDASLLYVLGETPILAERPLRYQIHPSAEETLQILFQTEVAVEEI